jgi:N-acylneuraminate cytidylyltransferase
MKIAVIPARGGSKRITKKNIRPFFGKPIIGWTIEAARNSGCFEKIIVSSDDDEIAQVARSYGAEVPFMRPADISNDHAGTTPVMAHATQWLIDAGIQPSLVCCLYATAPFIQASDIQRGLAMMKTGNIDFAFTVTRYSSPIQRALRIRGNGPVEMFNPDQFNQRSQDLEPAWHDAGQFYWGSSEAWLKELPVFAANSMPIDIPGHRVQDIDSLEDWKRAEILFQVLQDESLLNLGADCLEH